MADQPNPYTPGAGDRPHALVGRVAQLALADAVRSQIEANYAANCLIFTGLRGVGKTVLLKEVTDRLLGRGWTAERALPGWWTGSDAVRLVRPLAAADPG